VNKRRLKYVASIVAGQSPSGEDVTEAGDFPFLQGCAEFGDKYPVPTKFCSAPPKRAHKGAWLISVRAPVGQLNYADQDYGIGRGVAGISAKTIDRHFLGYILRHSVATLRSIATGSTYEASAGQVGNLSIPYPDIATQQAIADFLDRETARIDQLIEKKERQVELLGEKLEAQNAECITLGLNSDVTKRTTNIDWAREIPVHWSTANLRQLFASAEYGISESMSDEGELAVLRMGNIQDGEIVCDSLGFVDRVDRRLTLRSGDLLFNRTNSRDLVGKVGIFHRSDGDKFSFASYLVRIRPSEITQSEYLNLLLNSRPVLGAARALAIPSISQSNLNPNRYGSIPVPLPPVGEQKEIAAHLSLLISKNSDIERCIKSSLARLRELRAALITAAATGQIDVATWRKRGQTDRRLDAIEADMATDAQPRRKEARA
jgi:type I restriction enzyme S subunit